MSNIGKRKPNLKQSNKTWFSKKLTKQFKYLSIKWKIKIHGYQPITFQRRVKQLMHIPICTLLMFVFVVFHQVVITP